MSRIARQPTPDTLALADLDQAKAIMRTPSILVPPEVRPALFECWACHRHLAGLDTPLPIAALVSTWIGRYDLRPDDAIEMLHSIQHPDHCAKHKFASDLTATLAGLVSVRLKQRRAEAETIRRRDEDEEATRNALPPDVLRAMLAGIGVGMS